MLFALNPNAGKGAKNNAMFKVTDAFIKNGFEVDTYITQYAGDLTKKLSDSASYYDTVAVWGGDGTLNEAVNGLVSCSSSRAALGYIPRGTTNDFAKSLKIPKDVIKACDNICLGTPKYCDLGSFNGRCYTYVAAFGAFTEVSYSTSHAKKKLLAHFAYVLDGAKSIPSIKSIHARVNADGTVYEGDYVYGMVSNTKSVGGFKLPDVSVDMNDGMLELILIKMPKNIGEWKGLLSTLLSQKMSSPLITVVKIKSATFEFDENIPWTVDGEFGGSSNTASIKVLSSSLNIIVPADYAEKGTK